MKDLNTQVTIAMATHPLRKKIYVNAVYELLPYCDRFCICFNGYDEIPDNLPPSNKIIAALANGKNGNPIDLGCNNKMMWAGDFPGYYATVDDDIDYPPNYIRSLKAKVDCYGRRAICSYHGHYYPIMNGKIDFMHRRIAGFQNMHPRDMYCHRLGMGVAMCCPQDIGLDKSMFLSMPKNFGDDEITAVWAQKNNIPLIRVENKNVQMFENMSHSRIDGLCVNKQSVVDRIKYLEQYDSWRLNTLPGVKLGVIS